MKMAIDRTSDSYAAGQAVGEQISGLLNFSIGGYSLTDLLMIFVAFYVVAAIVEFFKKDTQEEE
jgi:hypothetical protein